MQSVSIHLFENVSQENITCHFSMSFNVRVGSEPNAKAEATNVECFRSPLQEIF